MSLLLVAGLLLAARLALPFVMRSAINSRLEKIPDYTGWVDRVGVSLFRGAYTLHGIVVQKRVGGLSVPYFRAEKIDFSVAWRELFHGKFVADIDLDKPMLTLIAGPSSDLSQLVPDKRWQEAINDIFPISLTWLKVADGELRYINDNTTPKLDLRIAHLQALATGLRNRAQDEQNEFPATIALRGETIGGGRLNVAAQLEPLALEPHCLVKLELEKVSLPALNEFLRAYGGIDVSKGRFSCYVEVLARSGHFQGYLKPFFDQVDFSEPAGEKRPLTQSVREWFVATFAWAFKNHARDEVATRMPFSGEFKKIDFHTWETIKSLLRHAFIHPLAKQLDSKSPGGAGAKDEKGLLPKAAGKLGASGQK